MKRFAPCVLLLCVFASGCVIKTAPSKPPQHPATAAEETPGQGGAKRRPIRLKPVVPIKDYALVPFTAEVFGRGQGAPVRGVSYQSQSGRVSTRCTSGGTSPTWFCASDRWFAGENRKSTIEHPNTKTANVLSGVDLGIAVPFGPNGRTYFYMGDTMGKPALGGCGADKAVVDCNDAILVVDTAPTAPVDKNVAVDTDPTDGITTSLVVPSAHGGAGNGFVPLLIPGVNGEGALPQCGKNTQRGETCLGKFNVPTGALAVNLSRELLPASLYSGPATANVVLLWFANAAAIYDEGSDDPLKGERRAASWLAVSNNGVRFDRLIEKPFSRDKFIQVAPVLIRQNVRLRTCAADPTSPLCDKALGRAGDVVLLFGSGEPYRKSPLYLASLRLSDLEVLYYVHDAKTGAELWSNAEADATPVITKRPNPLLGRNKKPGRLTLFGELSVKLVEKDACPPDTRSACEDTLVLLSTQDAFVRIRTAPLTHPGARAQQPGKSSWSKSLRTSALGYGPYIIDPFTQIERGADGKLALVMFHTISSWDGASFDNPAHNPYGVYTRQLRLIDEASCTTPKDKRAYPYCRDKVPQWPLFQGPRPAEEDDGTEDAED